MQDGTTAFGGIQVIEEFLAFLEDVHANLEKMKLWRVAVILLTAGSVHFLILFIIKIGVALYG